MLKRFGKSENHKRLALERYRSSNTGLTEVLAVWLIIIVGRMNRILELNLEECLQSYDEKIYKTVHKCMLGYKKGRGG